MASPKLSELRHVDPESRLRSSIDDDPPDRRSLLTAVRNDDAPAVLRLLADGAQVADLGEASGWRNPGR